MAGVYIEGIKMPVGEELLCLNIFPDGKVTNHFKLRCDGIGRAFPVPDHGRLVDVDALYEKFMNAPPAQFTTKEVAVMIDWEEVAPTIIPAEENK